MNIDTNRILALRINLGIDSDTARRVLSLRDESAQFEGPGGVCDDIDAAIEAADEDALLAILVEHAIDE